MASNIKLVGSEAINELAKKTKETYLLKKDYSNHATKEDLDNVLSSLKNITDIDATNYMSNNYTDSYNDINLLSDDVITKFRRNKVINYKAAFSGCAKLKNINWLDTSNAVSLADMFKDCSSLPGVFPWIISCKSIDERIDNINGIFSGSSVTIARFEDVPDSLIANMTADNLGTSLNMIIINGRVKV